MSRLPNFIIIGTQKAGTTSVGNYLNEHPDLYVVPQEVHYFARLNSKPYYTPNQSVIFKAMSLADYQALFADTKARYVGEKSPSYMVYPNTAQAIADTCPDVKIIAILRNPVKRAFSAFLHAVMNGHEVTTDFAEGLAREEERIAAAWDPLFYYYKNGLYTEQLQPYFDLFPAENIKIILFDDLKQPLDVMRDLYAFVGVDPNFTPTTESHYNTSGIPNSRFSAIWSVWKQINRRYPFLNDLIPKDLRASLKSSITYTPTLSHDMEVALIARYTDEVRQLERLIGRDLGHWLQIKASSQPLNTTESLAEESL